VLITEPAPVAVHVLQMRASAADTVNSAEQKAAELRDKAADKAGEVSGCFPVMQLHPCSVHLCPVRHAYCGSVNLQTTALSTEMLWHSQGYVLLEEEGLTISSHAHIVQHMYL
jgi:hypothetical protein